MRLPRRIRRMLGILVLCGVGSRVSAAQDVETTARVRIRSAPAFGDNILQVLPRHTTATLSDSNSSGFFKVQTAAGLDGWVHGHYLVPTSGEALAVTGTAGGGYPACGGEHFYRWAVKKDHSDIPGNATNVSIATILGWAAGDLGRDLGSWCADRGGRELRAYSVVGWVRRVRKHENDRDWHVELTATASSPVGSCVIVEIPDPAAGAEYGAARRALDQLLEGSTTDPDNGNVSPAVQARFTGAAYYDGWHKTSQDHGRCNSTPGAIWELHPVYEVGPP